MAEILRIHGLLYLLVYIDDSSLYNPLITRTGSLLWVIGLLEPRTLNLSMDKNT